MKKFIAYLLLTLITINPAFATWNNIAAGDPILASKAIQNWKHLNFGSALMPVDTDGNNVDSTIDIGSNSYFFKDGHLDTLTLNGALSGVTSIDATNLNLTGTASNALIIVKRSDSATATGRIGFSGSDDVEDVQFGTNILVGGGAEINTGGTNRIYVSPAGDIGLNESAPGSLLHLTKAAATSTTMLTLENSTAVDQANISEISFKHWSSNWGFGEAATIKSVSETGANSPGSLVFATSPTNQNPAVDYMYLKSDGKLGLGVSDPDTALEILDTSTQLKLSYDGSNYATLTVNSSGALTLATNSGDISVDGKLIYKTTTATSVTASAITSGENHYNFTASLDNNYTINTINGGDYGQTLTISNLHSSNTITVSHTGAIHLAGGADAVLGQYDTVSLIYYQGVWMEISRSNNS